MLLSICIPTRGRVDVLKNTLESIAQESIDPACLEVVISDNSDGDEISELARVFKNSGMNLVYHKSTEKSPYNLVVPMLMAKGSFIKLHNDYSAFLPGGIHALINFITNNEDSRPQTLFCNGNLTFRTTKYSANFDQFIADSSYWNTWSSAFSIWRSDLDLLDTSKAALDENFPHVSLLFSNRDKASYCVDNHIYFINQPVTAKGGYNIFKLFCVDYVGMLKELISYGAITDKTYRTILCNLRDKFIPRWLQASVYTNNGLTFDNADHLVNIKQNFNGIDFIIIQVRASAYVIRWYIKELVKKCLPMRTRR